MAKEKIQSVEPDIADLANGWMKSYGLDYKLEQASLNTEIDKALDEYYSKSGGSGGNRPDAKLLLQDKNMNYYPVLIEYKGYKDKLVKLDNNGQVENRNTKNEPIYKNINSYAVNGAVHYANALLHYTSYTDIIAIGITGYKDENGKLLYSMGVYYVSRSNYGVGQKIDDYTDLSFLKTENFDSFIEKIRNLMNVDEVVYDNNILLVTYKKGKNNLVSIMEYLKKEDIKYNKIYSERPTLNDVFLELTGKELRD